MLGCHPSTNIFDAICVTKGVRNERLCFKITDREMRSGILSRCNTRSCNNRNLTFCVKFDINEFIESRKKRHRKLAQSYCPHMDLIPRRDNSFQVNSLFYTPFGTPNWFCSRCGAVLPYEPDQEKIKAKATYYLNHPKAYKKAMRKYNKHAKKSL